jgi:aryl-alcohol dehydrogenase-like predicted oxidoreductase
MNDNHAMERRGLGSTGLTVTPIGLGLAALGRPAYINLHRDHDLGPHRSVNDMERRCHRVLDAAYRADLRYFDVARSYGYAERFLSSWLDTRAIEPGRVTVGSKWGYTYVGEWRLDVDAHEVKDHSLAALKRQYTESKLVLGDHLSLYQIHSATLESGVLSDGSVLSELAAMREGGLVIGLSLSGPRQKDALRRALEADIDGVNPFSCVQATFNILERSAAAALEEARGAGWGVIVKEALANGRLAPQRDGHDSPARVILEQVARRRDVSLDAVAISWALSHPFVDVALSGAVTTEQLQSNIAAVDLELTDEESAALAAVAEKPEDYWASRRTLAWS